MPVETLELGFGDPLGLSRGTVKASGMVTLVVHPELVDLGPLHALAGSLACAVSMTSDEVRPK